MPTNVPPQYREAEERFREAETTQAKIAALRRAGITVAESPALIGQTLADRLN